MTIDLPPELERSVQAAVHEGHFASLDDAMTEAASLLLQRLKQTHARASAHPASPVADAPKQKRIWEIAADIRNSIPAEEWAKLPVDGAEQHDHYIYGTPKRPAS